MGMLYRIELADEAKTVVKLGDPWPVDTPGPDGVSLSDGYLVGAMFYSPAEEAVEDEEGNEVGEDLPAYFELWAQPRGVADPPEDHPTLRMRLWLDAPMKSTIEIWKWADMEKAIALRMGFDPDTLIEQQVPAPAPAQAQNQLRSPALTAASP